MVLFVVWFMVELWIIIGMLFFVKFKLNLILVVLFFFVNLKVVSVFFGVFFEYFLWLIIIGEFFVKMFCLRKYFIVYGVGWGKWSIWYRINIKMFKKYNKIVKYMWSLYEIVVSVIFIIIIIILGFGKECFNNYCFDCCLFFCNVIVKFLFCC